MVKATIADIERTEQKKEADQAPVYAQMKSDVAQDRSRFQDVAKDYTPIKETPPPARPQNDPLAAFGSASAIFATLASAFTHTPAINAMNALGSAINAKNRNDWQTYEQQYKQWKDQTELAIQHHKLQADDMKNAMEMMKDDLATGVAMAKAVAAQSDDHIATRLLEQGQYKDLADHQLAAGRAAAAMQESALRIQDMHMDLTMKRDQFQAAQALAQTQPGTPEHAAALQKVIDLATGLHPEMVVNSQRAQDAKNQVVTDPTNGKQYVYNPITRQSTTLDGQPYSPGGQAKLGQSGTPAADQEKDIQDITADRIAQAEKNGTTLTDAQKAQIRTDVRNQIAGEKKLATDAAGAISHDAAVIVAQRVIAGDERATVGMARSNANMTKVANEIVVQAKQQGLSGNDIAIRIAEFQGMTSAERTLGTREANMEIAANVVRGMVPTALDTSAKVSRSQYPTLNAVILAANRGTGDENVVRFGQAANAIIYEYAKFLNPTGVPTDSDKARATDILNTAWTQGQFAAALDQIVNKEIPAGATGIAATRGEFRAGLGTSTTAAPSGQTVPVISDKSAYDALPPGSHYRKADDPPNSYRTKQ